MHRESEWSWITDDPEHPKGSHPLTYSACSSFNKRNTGQTIFQLQKTFQFVVIKHWKNILRCQPYVSYVKDLLKWFLFVLPPLLLQMGLTSKTYKDCNKVKVGMHAWQEASVSLQPYLHLIPKTCTSSCFQLQKAIIFITIHSKYFLVSDWSKPHA